MDRRPITVAFPVDQAHRDALRQVIAKFNDPRIPGIPAVYPGSIQLPCSECRELLWVGPRLQAVKNARLLCVRCCIGAVEKAGGLSDIVNLGNPDSAFEQS
jgi:hypothetical protein